MKILSGLLVGAAFTVLFTSGPIIGAAIFSLALVCAAIAETLE
jgi:hypothetical protein